MNFAQAQFDYNPNTKTYIAEASTLGIMVPHKYISIDGHAFVFAHTDKDASGEDIMGWRFKPTMQSVSSYGAPVDCGVLIIND